MEMANGNPEINFIQDPGNSINLKDRDISNQPSRNITEILKMGINMDKEFNCSITEIAMMGYTLMENQKEMELILGAMAPFIRDSSRMA